ncbi:MAG: motility protein A [bacterium]
MINLTSWLGILVSVIVIGVSIISTTNNPAIFFNLPGLGIVLGGIGGTILLAYKSSSLIRIFRSIFHVFFDKLETPRKVALRFTDYAKIVGEHGVVGLERELANLKPGVERDSLELIVAGYKPHEIETIISNEIEKWANLENEDAEVFETLARFAPAFGMIGTIVGLIVMLQNMGNDVSHLGPALAVALITTFYGVILGTGLFSPIAIKIHRFTQMNLHIYNIILKGSMLIAETRNHIFVRDNLNAFLLEKYKIREKGGMKNDSAKNSKRKK